MFPSFLLHPLPAFLLTPFFSRCLTLVPRSLLLNRTETLATQAKTARSVRLVVAFVSYSEMTESSELKEADLLDATACLFKLGTDKACHRWSFMLKRERTATSIAEFKSYLTLNHGFKEVATSFGIMKFSTKIFVFV